MTKMASLYLCFLVTLKKTMVYTFDSPQELPKAESIGPTLIWPAVADADFIMASGELTFDIGQQSAGLDITLTPSIGSSNPTPKRFRVILSDATGGARIHPVYGMANVTLVSDTEAQAVWALLEQLHQPLDETLINRVLEGLINKVSIDTTHEQMTAVLDAVGKVRISVWVYISSSCYRWFPHCEAGTKYVFSDVAVAFLKRELV